MILVGDWALGKKYGEWRSKGAVVLANLESPILPLNHLFVPAPKAGPILFSYELPNETNQFVFALANNHLMDYCAPGLEATLKSLEQRGFEACGAGKNAYDARQPIIVNDMGAQIGIIACCEAQFGVARPNSAGVAEFGPWVYDSIRELKKSTDAVVVSVHAAVEDSPWPSPYIQELYRSYIDSGATVIHGHHAHVPQGYEEYRGGVIFYGMGNLAVDPNKWRDNPNNLWSVGAEILVLDGMTAFLKTKSIACVIFEINYFTLEGFGFTVSDLMRFWTRFDYRLWHLDQDGSLVLLLGEWPETHIGDCVASPMEQKTNAY